jgi:acetyl-CoA carboxylase biotin carboxylase subunit
VREQIRVAWGEKLSFAQEDVSWDGHSIECRVYAEDPDNNFLPSPGRITRLRIPRGPGIRDDGGVYEGAEVSIYYDPMISKFAVYGRNREEAIDRMRRALKEYEIGGIKTTLPFFREIMEDEEFIAGRLDTGFIGRFNERKKQAEIPREVADMALIAAALAYSGKSDVSPSVETAPAPSRWAIAGRVALHQNRI